MKYPLFGALQNSAKGFGRVVMDIAASKFFVTMVNPIMGAKLIANGSIRMVFIGHQMRSFINKSIHLRKKFRDLITGHRCGPDRAIAFNRYKYSLLFSAATAFMYDALFIARLTTDVFFIQFDDALQRRNQLRSRVHHFPNGMAKFPSAFSTFQC